MRDILFAICLLCSLAAHAVHAQDLSLLAGGLKQHHTDQQSYAWSLDYQRRLGERAALGLTYLNEGHPDNHHRDGIAAMIWARNKGLQPGLALAAGIGPYYYFDTTSVNQVDHLNDHGWGTLASLTATWHTQRRWFVQLRANRVIAPASIVTSSVLLGVGYRLDDTPVQDAQRSGSSSNGSASGQELTLSAGRIIVNSFKSEDAVAASLEYRRGLAPHIEWTVTWLNENDARQLHRQGLATQLWRVRPLNRQFALGVGAGLYLAIDRDRRNPAAEDERKRLAGLLSISMRYRVSPDFLVRLSWSRVVTDYHRDSDLLLIGVGYAF